LAVSYYFWSYLIASGRRLLLPAGGCGFSVNRYCFQPSGAEISGLHTATPGTAETVLPAFDNRDFP
jgi:hypothetical protein